jgi:hypothetical protein
VAVRELEQQKDRLAAYQVQPASPSPPCTTIAANADTGHPAKPSVPVQKGGADEPARQ